MSITSDLSINETPLSTKNLQIPSMYSGKWSLPRCFCFIIRSLAPATVTFFLISEAKSKLLGYTSAFILNLLKIVSVSSINL